MEPPVAGGGVLADRSHAAAVGVFVRGVDVCNRPDHRVGCAPQREIMAEAVRGEVEVTAQTMRYQPGRLCTTVETCRIRGQAVESPWPEGL